MTDQNDDENAVEDAAEKPVQVYKIRTSLKNKLGMRVTTNEEGHLAAEKINEADSLIREMCKGCHDNIGKNLEEMILIWKDMQTLGEGDGRTSKAQGIFTKAHEIKDIASLCGYTLAAHFAESLRDYIAETTLSLKNQTIIIQAHVDALTVVHKTNLKEDGGPAADELKKMVKVAIDKYH
tara:strand:- start:198 stop:737 length:540 start_codon:yes stop_codon:yes gene_type:complete